MGNERQKAITAEYLTGHEKAYGIECPECRNKGCTWCKSTPNSVYNTRLAREAKHEA